MVLSLFLPGGAVSAFLQKRLQQLRAEPVAGAGEELYCEQGAVSQGLFPGHISCRGIEAAEPLLSGKCLRLVVIAVYRTP
ncbi:hypothetical protein D3C75_873690 [compost metagenome]